MDKHLINDVRQVLMNELGLTRESVRAEMVKIVEQTIEKAFNDTAIEARITRFIEAKIQKALNPWGGKGELEKLVRAQVEAEAKAQARALIAERVIVSLSLREPATREG